MTHYHITLVGWDKMRADATLAYACRVNLIAFDVKSAIQRAKEIYPKKHWYISDIVECFALHGGEPETLEDVMSMVEQMKKADEKE